MASVFEATSPLKEFHKFTDNQVGQFNSDTMRHQLRKIFLIGIVCGIIWGFSSLAWAGPTFLNRQAYPFPLVLNEIGPYHNNYLKTFELLTQWNNESNDKIMVKIAFTIYDNDSSGTKGGEDGKDDPLMTVTETITVPEQVGYWGKSFRLTAIGEKLNQGFDHPGEGAGLELYVDAQITYIQHVSEGN